MNTKLTDKFLHSSSLKIVLFIIVTSLILTILSCEKVTKYLTDDKLNGKYTFTLTGLESYQDTTLIKGMRGTDFPEYSTTYEDFYLYEDDEGNVCGNCKMWKLNGQRDGEDVVLNLYINPQGTIYNDPPIDSMYLFSTMNLTVNDFGNLEGEGYYHAYEYYPEIVNETFNVVANKINDLKQIEDETGCTKFSFCDIIKDIDSFLIKHWLHNKFRRMHSCDLHKNGGGYYVFGHEGPGEYYSVATVSAYFPWEYSWCKVRRYHFTIEMKDEFINYDDLRTKVQDLDNSMDGFAKGLGFESIDQLLQLMDDFHQNFGGFAFAAMDDSHTHNSSLYVFHTEGSNDAAKDHEFTQKIKKSMESNSSGVWLYASSGDISDHWHLRRSQIGVCNSILSMAYLFGTHKVNFD